MVSFRVKVKSLVFCIIIAPVDPTLSKENPHWPHKIGYYAKYFNEMSNVNFVLKIIKCH